MNKTEASIVKREIRCLKASLNTRQKQAAKEIKKRRVLIRSTEKEISGIERECAAFVQSVTTRLAVIDGRLNS